MAKREISSTLRNLKFMQRSAQKEEKKKKNVEEPNGNFPSLDGIAKKCVVITDWDPQPGALSGRMSFQSFNPTIEKMYEEAINGDATPTSSSSSSSSKVEPSRETNGELKRKQSQVLSEEQQNHPNKSPRKLQSNDKPSPSNNRGFKKPKSKKVDWSVLKPPKPQNKKGFN